MSNVIITIFSAAGYDRAAQGVAGAGRRLADQLGGQLHAIVIGAHNPLLNTSLAAIADAVVSADQAELIEALKLRQQQRAIGDARRGHRT
jgi:hypothetical protein